MIYNFCSKIWGRITSRICFFSGDLSGSTIAVEWFFMTNKWIYVINVFYFYATFVISIKNYKKIYVQKYSIFFAFDFKFFYIRNIR